MSKTSISTCHCAGFATVKLTRYSELKLSGDGAVIKDEFKGYNY